jgi:putative oxidoreductase
MRTASHLRPQRQICRLQHSSLCTDVLLHILGRTHLPPTFAHEDNTMKQTAPPLHAAPADEPTAAHVERNRLHAVTTLSTALTTLRIGTAALFMAHAVVRATTPGAIPQFGAFLEKTGIPYGVATVYAITLFEILGGALLVLGIRARVLAAGFAIILVVGIALIHRHRGWFVGEHGTGGSEYSVALLLALFVIAAADRAQPARDAGLRSDRARAVRA